MSDKKRNLFKLDHEGDPLEDFNLFFPDVRELVKRDELSTYPPDPEKAQVSYLQTQEGMEWLAGCNFILKSPDSSTSTQQEAELDLFFHELYNNAVQIPEHFRGVFGGATVNDPLIAIDTETSGLDTRVMYDHDGNLRKQVELVGLCLAVDKNEGYYLPIQNTEEDGVPNWDLEPIIKFIDKLHANFTVIYHNAAYDREVLAINGVSVFREFPNFFDTQIVSFVSNMNEKRQGLKALSQRYLGRKMIPIKRLFEVKKAKKGDNEDYIDFRRLPAINSLVYGASDSCNTIGILEYFLNQEDSINVFKNQPIPLQIDHELSDTLRDLYRVGMPVQLEYFMDSSLDTVLRIQTVSNAIWDAAGDKELDINSPSKLADIIYNVLQIPPLPYAEKKKAGYYPTDQDTLEKLLDLHPDQPFLVMIVHFRKLNNALSKFNLKVLYNSFSDYFMPWMRVQLQFNQTNIPSGRLSSSSNTGAAERVIVTRTKAGNITHKFLKQAGDCGLNSQGVPSQYFDCVMDSPLKSLPPEAGIDPSDPYGEDVKTEFLTRLSLLGK